MEILQVNEISKTYNSSIKALDNVSFKVPKGSVFGILGPNGSGKTTLLGIVMDVLKANKGTYSWFEEGNSPEQRKKIGTLLETPNFYHYLSAEQNLKITCAIKDKNTDDIERVLKIVNLWERRKSKFSTYSLGMKQRLAIAAALLGDPEVLVFDEPTNGLDPAGIAEIRNLIKELSLQGKTIIMASHILDEVEKVCNYVAILRKGVLITSGTVKDIMHTNGNDLTANSNSLLIEIASDNNQKLAQIVNSFNGVISVLTTENSLLIEVNENKHPASINQQCFAQGITLSMLQIKTKTLETRFLEITGNKSDK